MLNYVSITLRLLMTFICTMSCIVAKLGPELGITPEMVGMDSKAAAQEWVKIWPWQYAAFKSGSDSGIGIRYFIAIWLIITIFHLWKAPALGATMFVAQFIGAELTVLGVSKLPNAMPNPNCPNKAPWCPEVQQFHGMLIALGVAVLTIELLFQRDEKKKDE